MLVIAHRQLNLDHGNVGPMEVFDLDEETALALEARGLVSPVPTAKPRERKVVRTPETK